MANSTCSKCICGSITSRTCTSVLCVCVSATVYFKTRPSQCLIMIMTALIISIALDRTWTPQVLLDIRVLLPTRYIRNNF